MVRSDPSAVVAIGPDAYRVWRSSRLGAITERLEHVVIAELIGNPKGMRALDIGCGDGGLASFLTEHGASVVGIDPDPCILQVATARAAAEQLPIRFVEGRAEALPFPDNSFDLVTAVTVLCFVRDGRTALQEMHRVLRPHGRLVLGELGRWSLWAARRRVRGWFGSPIWHAARCRSAHELRSLAEEAEFAVEDVRGSIDYPPSAIFACVMARFDRWFGHLTTFGAAFIVIQARKRASAAVAFG